MLSTTSELFMLNTVVLILGVSFYLKYLDWTHHLGHTRQECYNPALGLLLLFLIVFISLETPTYLFIQMYLLFLEHITKPLSDPKSRSPCRGWVVPINCFSKFYFCSGVWVVSFLFFHLSGYFGLCLGYLE